MGDTYNLVVGYRACAAVSDAKRHINNCPRCRRAVTEWDEGAMCRAGQFLTLMAVHRLTSEQDGVPALASARWRDHL
jgi:hypothetical protein